MTQGKDRKAVLFRPKIINKHKQTNKTTPTQTIVENKQNNCFYLHVVVKLIRQNNSKGR